MSLATPIVLADGLDVTFYSAVEDVWLDVEPCYVEEDYRLYDAGGRRLELVADYLVRPLEETPTGAEELAGLLRVWLPLVGVKRDEPDGPRAAASRSTSPSTARARGSRPPASRCPAGRASP